ncbi:MAG: PqqD family protein [Elusimicrobia bacterium]|nr:PqqD family protein [Elusimicrobiota bacterium]
MGYSDLIRLGWRTGKFLAPAGERLTRERGPRPDPEERRGLIRGEMEEIVRREAADALGCLAPRGEATMKLAPFVKFREEKFGAVLFETRSEKVFTLNPTAAGVVREVLAGASEKELGERLLARYADPAGKLQGEALTLVRQLKDKGLLTD